MAHILLGLFEEALAAYQETRRGKSMFQSLGSYFDPKLGKEKKGWAEDLKGYLENALKDTKNQLTFFKLDYESCEDYFEKIQKRLAHDTSANAYKEGFFDKLLTWLIVRIKVMKDRYLLSEVREMMRNLPPASRTVSWISTQDPLYPKWVLENVIDQYLALLDGCSDFPQDTYGNGVYQVLYPDENGWDKISPENQKELQKEVENLKKHALDKLRTNMQVDQIKELMMAYLERFINLSPTLKPFCEVAKMALNLMEKPEPVNAAETDATAKWAAEVITVVEVPELLQISSEKSIVNSYPKKAETSKPATLPSKPSLSGGMKHRK